MCFVYVNVRAVRKCGVKVTDFGSSWRDGVAFNALIHGLRPELVDMEKLSGNTTQANLEHAFTTAEKHLGIPRLLDVEGILSIGLLLRIKFSFRIYN